MDPIIKVEGLTKEYRLYDRKSDRLKEALSFTKKQYYTPFYALNDISFHVNKGETLGIIGTNGSGKSTLLKILTGVVTQTSGIVEINGKISALLELGTGFNPEYTGIENIFLNCTMMGFSQEETQRKIQGIIDFADIGEYIHQPVKNYSSGMFARLAFAVAISVEPDILIVDEALSVGDMRFQVKCMDHMKKMMENGTTILFVSHDLAAVRRFCQRCIWIQNGRLMTEGETNHVADRYTDYLKSNDLSVTEETPAEEDGVEPFTPVPEGSDAIASVKSVELFSGTRKIHDTIPFNAPLTVEVTYDVYDATLANPMLGVALFGMDDQYVCGLNTILDHVSIPWEYGRNRFAITYPQGLRVLGGKYYFDVALRDRTATVNFDYRKCVRTVTVETGYVAEGVFVLPHQWQAGRKG